MLFDKWGCKGFDGGDGRRSGEPRVLAGLVKKLEKL
jgi:hypothetical protein